MDLGTLLRNQSLERFEAAFRDNGIDESVLPHLTQDHLRELGIPLGARIKLLAAIAGLAKGSESHTPAAMTAEGAPADAAERRHITVLFCDLVGSTPLSTRMDPEDLRKLISAYQKCVTEAVQRFGGFVAKYMGDGVLVYFGYPEAHEDDAERAVRSGLELVSEVVKLKTGTPLQTRVGIATGLVVVGDLVGSGQAQERGIVGETPNLAARLQGFAEPDTVVIADATRQLLGNLFELRDLGLQELKGIAGGVQIWAPVRPTTVEGRFEAFHLGNLTSFVGREEESELLQRRWSTAKAGEGQVVLISGEAGIGKSRLTAVFLQQISEEPHARLRCFCSPQRTDSALYPMIGHLERAARLAHDDSAWSKLNKLDAVLARSATSPEDSALFAELLSLSNDGRYPELTLDPQQRRKKTLEAFVTQVASLSHAEPVLMILEDAHWSDPSSLELVGRILERIVELSVLLIITFRPEFAPPWIGLPHVTAVTINRLGRKDIDVVIDRIVGNKFLPIGVREEIIDRTDGIPLFIEEMAKAVLEAESEDEARRTTAAIPPPKLEIPATLHASLMARLDRLGSAKELAQIGSAIGREFAHALMEAVAGKSRAELEGALNRLISAGLLFRRGVPPHATYTFKHALVQSAAYSTLLRERRRQLHARIASVLEGEFPDLVTTQPQLLAHHCSQAGLNEKAIACWLEAAQRALQRSAMIEAESQLRKGMNLLASLPDGPGRRQQELDLQGALGQALIATKGYATSDVGDAFARASALAQNLDRRDHQVPLLYGHWAYRFVRAEHSLALPLANQIKEIGEQRGDDAARLLGYSTQGVTRCLLGESEVARTLLEQCHEMAAPAHRAAYITLTGADQYPIMLLYLAIALTYLGYLDQARSRLEEALSAARGGGHSFTVVLALAWATVIQAVIRSRQDVEQQANELLALADEHGYRFFSTVGLMLREWASTGPATIHNGVNLFRNGLTEHRNSGAAARVPLFLLLLAEIHANHGSSVEGLNCLADAEQLAKTTDEQTEVAEIYRLRGELLAQNADGAAAQQNYLEALAIAARQGAKLYELRAATSLARLWRDRGERAKARELLSRVYDWFREGFEMLDLQQAKTLLNELA